MAPVFVFVIVFVIVIDFILLFPNHSLMIDGHRGVLILDLPSHFLLPVLLFRAGKDRFRGEISETEGIAVEVALRVGLEMQLLSAIKGQGTQLRELHRFPLLEGVEHFVDKAGDSLTGFFVRDGVKHGQSLSHQPVFLLSLGIETQAGGRFLELVGDHVDLGSFLMTQKRAQSGNDDYTVVMQQVGYDSANIGHTSSSLGRFNKSCGVSMA